MMNELSYIYIYIYKYEGGCILYIEHITVTNDV